MPPISPIHAAFGAALRELRAERGMSQEAVALEAGLNRGYYSGVERGVRNVALANIVKIANALNVPPSEVLGRAEANLNDWKHS